MLPRTQLLESGREGAPFTKGTVREIWLEGAIDRLIIRFAAGKSTDIVGWTFSGMISGIPGLSVIVFTLPAVTRLIRVTGRTLFSDDSFMFVIDDCQLVNYILLCIFGFVDINFLRRQVITNHIMIG